VVYLCAALLALCIAGVPVQAAQESLGPFKGPTVAKNDSVISSRKILGYFRPPMGRADFVSGNGGEGAGGMRMHQ
jgi:hypothetical protein